jgi:hypothetical protein
MQREDRPRESAQPQQHVPKPNTANFNEINHTNESASREELHGAPPKGVETAASRAQKADAVRDSEDRQNIRLPGNREIN